MRQGGEIRNLFFKGCVCVCVLMILTVLLRVHLGGTSCQTEGREDPSRPGENQGGSGQKGRTTFVLKNLVIFTAHCISL